MDKKFLKNIGFMGLFFWLEFLLFKISFLSLSISTYILITVATIKFLMCYHKSMKSNRRFFEYKKDCMEKITHINEDWFQKNYSCHIDDYLSTKFSKKIANNLYFKVVIEKTHQKEEMPKYEWIEENFAIEHSKEDIDGYRVVSDYEKNKIIMRYIVIMIMEILNIFLVR